MMKMCQAMTRPGISVECVLPGRFPKEKLFDHHGISDRFEVTLIPFTNGPGRQLLHGLRHPLPTGEPRGREDDKALFPLRESARDVFVIHRDFSRHIPGWALRPETP